MATPSVSGLEGLPFELFQQIVDLIPLESKVALALTSRTMEHKIQGYHLADTTGGVPLRWYGNLVGAKRAALLKLLEHDMDDAYCDTCDLLHSATPASDGATQSLARPCDNVCLPEVNQMESTGHLRKHVIYALTKNFYRGRDVQHLHQFLETTRTETLQISKVEKSYQNVFKINQLGIFWQSRQCYTIAALNDRTTWVGHAPELSMHLHACNHAQLKVRLIVETDRKFRLRVNCTNKFQRIQDDWFRCWTCNVEFLLETSHSELGHPQLHITTWRYIGRGRSSLDFDKYVQGPYLIRSDLELPCLGGEIAAESGMPTALGTLATFQPR